jgi:hypothetical protein
MGQTNGATIKLTGPIVNGLKPLRGRGRYVWDSRVARLAHPRGIDVKVPGLGIGSEPDQARCWPAWCRGIRCPLTESSSANTLDWSRRI